MISLIVFHKVQYSNKNQWVGGERSVKRQVVRTSNTLGRSSLPMSSNMICA